MPGDALAQVTDGSKVTTVELNFPAPARAGKYKYTVHVVSDSYLGLDHEVPFVLEVGKDSRTLVSVSC